MRKKIKLTVGGLIILAGALLLPSCTASFCSELDKAHFLYAFDYGVSDYYDHQIEGAQQVFPGNDKIYYLVNVPTSTASGLGKTNDAALSANLKTPSHKYYVKIDQLVLETALKKAKGDDVDFATVNFADAIEALDTYGYLKFSGEKLWDNWNDLNQKIKAMTTDPTHDISIDDLPTYDYIKIYQKNMNSLIGSYRSCIAISTDDYGYYGYANGAQYRDGDKIPVEIEAKTWGYAWKKGFFEGLLVFPIGWLTETFVRGFKDIGVMGGVAQLLAILLITFIVRSLMLIVTLKQTASNAKMQALQPEIAKIQNKYPNANTNNYEKQQMAAEMSRLYKKNKINPLSTLLVMIIQFPVFISVWGALQGSASLASDALFNLHLSDPINVVLFEASNWSNGSAVAALILFIMMAGVQVVSMLLPQWLQKRKAKNIPSMGKNPAQTQQQSSMKMVTYVMMAMIIFMGFTLPSAMGVYWFVSALFSLAQTLIVEKINKNKSKKKGN
ncbi:MAG TPA: membrane protein insertase YidC [Erysipelotrichaceae bacterium]|nr:membrane protein insertase YidC [Erysipelotrichaceae bacterium]